MPNDKDQNSDNPLVLVDETTPQVLNASKLNRDAGEYVLVATNPQEMEEQRKLVIQRCDRQLEKYRQQLAEYKDNQFLMKSRKLNTKQWDNPIRRTERTITFYENIKRASELGYYIVPDFPADAFAVRTTAKNPRKHLSENQYLDRTVKPTNLPQGEGRYVDPQPYTGSKLVSKKWNDEVKEIRQYFASEFDEELDFPVVAVKPRVVDATVTALGLKLFDELALMTPANEHNGFSGGSTVGDPVIIGRIYDPRASTYSRRAIAFMIAWWLDPSDI